MGQIPRSIERISSLSMKFMLNGTKKQMLTNAVKQIPAIQTMNKENKMVKNKASQFKMQQYIKNRSATIHTIQPIQSISSSLYLEHCKAEKAFHQEFHILPLTFSSAASTFNSYIIQYHQFVYYQHHLHECLCSHAHMHACMHACTHAMHACMHACTHACMHAQLHTLT